MVVLLLGLGCGAALADVIYVDDDASPGGNGQSWATAYKYLQDALAGADPCDEIWVARGSYFGTIQLVSGVQVYGGFTGDETTRDGRDWQSNKTKLWAGVGNTVRCEFCDSNTVLDGFIITGGIADTVRVPLGWLGGGMVNAYSNPIVRNCVFIYNFAIFGGGMANLESNPTVINCTFERNFAAPGFEPEASFECRGGGMYNEHSSPIIINCIFRANRTIETGFVGTHGGAICNVGHGFDPCQPPEYSSNPMIINCTFYDNRAGAGGAVSGEFNSNLTLTNCILWNNHNYQQLWNISSQVYTDQESTAVVNYSCVQGWAFDFPGTGNADVDPLLTQDGHLRAGSACINAGDPNFVPDANAMADFDAEQRVADGRVDIGADEFIDTDGDGLPDWWEQKYFGDPNVATPGADPDGDTLTNLAEYEIYSSNPNTLPYYIDVNDGNDTYDGLAPTPQGGGVGPKKTISEGMHAAGDGDTVLVAVGTYTDDHLNYDLESLLIVHAPNGAIIDCNFSGRAINASEFYWPVCGVLQGFTIINGYTGPFEDVGGGGICTSGSQFLFKDCVLRDNTASTRAGGLYSNLSSITFDNFTIGENTAPPNEPNAGFIEFSVINLQGDLSLEAGRLDANSSLFYGPGRINVGEGTLLKVGYTPSDYFGRAFGPTVVRADVNGPGDIHVEAGGQLIIEGDAVVNLSGSEECNPDPNTGGHIIVDGSLVVRGNATLMNTDVDVKLLDIDGANDIQFNNITLLEASTGFGGEFFAGGTATIKCNTIVSEGDRYLDMDPDPYALERPTISNNQITVIIKEGALGSRGTLLELRAADYDCNGPNNPDCYSGAHHVPDDSPGFTDDPSENWVLEKLILKKNSKLNLTNRQGFVFQDFNDPNIMSDLETVYVKQLVLGPNSVLNTGGQTLYYQELVDPNGAELLRDPNDPFAPLANGGRFEDIPLLGFSLAIIAMDDTTPSPHNEFDIRVRKRIRDRNDVQPPECPQYPSFCLEGSTERIDVDDDPRIPAGSGGVMDMRTQAPGKQSASSVAAKGAFARAGDENITVAFEYMFVDDPFDEAELIVYLSDKPQVGDNLIELARIRPPLPGQRGSIESGQFAAFTGTFSRCSLNFNRGTYVELELRGRGVRCWIDKWDPSVNCIAICGDFYKDIFNIIGAADYLVLVAECGLTNPASVGKGCLDLVIDGVVNTDDLMAWDVSRRLNLCPKEEGASALGELETQDMGGSGSLLLLGKPPAATGTYVPDSYLYSVDDVGNCTGDAIEPACSTLPCSHDGRVVTDSYNNVYQVDGEGRLIRQDGSKVLIPCVIDDGNNLVLVGLRDVNYDGKLEGFLLRDVCFNQNDANIVYVLPIQVRPKDGTCPYMAAAKLELTGAGNCNLAHLYGQNPATDPTQRHYKSICNEPNDFLYYPDLQHMLEIETDSNGTLFILSAHLPSSDNWILIYNEQIGNDSEVRIPLEDANLAGPTAMLVSPSRQKLYLASSVNPTNDLAAQVYRFSIDKTNPSDPNLVLDTVIEVNCPEPLVCSTTTVCNQELGFGAVITSMTEDPEDGTAYVTGFTTPRFPAYENLPYAEFGCDPIAQIGCEIFTTPMLAIIPPHISEPFEPIQATALTDCDLVLPFSMVWTGPLDCNAADITGDQCVDMKDLARLAQYWLESDCIGWAWCEGADVNRSNAVGWRDLGILAECWLKTECPDL